MALSVEEGDGLRQKMAETALELQQVLSQNLGSPLKA